MNSKEFIIWGESFDELETAADKVDAYMDSATGDNAIYYQIIGEDKPFYFDIGYITDKDLEELQQGFVITAA